MRFHRLLLLPLASALLAVSSLAQGVGSTMPRVELAGLTQTKATVYEDFYGRTVLIEFFAHWCGPCAASVPHLNELHEKYASKGLSIIGLTGDDENKSKTEDFVRQRKLAYAWAYDKDNKLASYFSVTGIPHAILVDPSGKVVWTGHPMELDEKTIQGALVGALKTPVFDFPTYAQALSAAKKLSAAENGPAMVEAIQRNIAGRVVSMKELLAQGDLLTAQTLATSLNTTLAGLPEQPEAAKVLAEIKANPNAPKIIESLKMVDAIDVETVKKRKDADKIQADLERVMADSPDSLAAKRAKAKRDRLIQIKPGLK